MKIISLQAENFKRLSVVEIKPDGNMVMITGRNAAGKSSVLDAIWAAIGGAAHIQSQPIRRGAKEAHIRLDLGEMVVTRAFKQGDAGYTTTIKVEAAGGFRAGSPQKMLDGLLDALSFDPLAFTRMKPDQQFDALRKFVPEVDFAAIERANKADFEKRTDVNRSAKQARAAAEQIVVPSGLPIEMEDEAALADQLAAAGKHNGELEMRRLRRDNVAQEIVNALAIAEQTDADLPNMIAGWNAARDDEIAEIRSQIAALEAKTISVRERWDETTAIAHTEAQQKAGKARAMAEELQAKLNGADALPEPIDVSAITAKMAKARRINDGIRARTLRDRQIENAETLEAQAAALTAAMEGRHKAKAQAIAAAKMPVEGLGFGDGIVTFNDIPFDQASDAERLRTSIAIAMASNPKLRVIRVRDGSLLDEDGLRMLAEMAEGRDFQVWIERVDSSGTVGFVLEDGHLKQTDLLASDAAQ
jgi:DNA repair exonuclease SbcCD ATPase subunit